MQVLIGDGIRASAAATRRRHMATMPPGGRELLIPRPAAAPIAQRRGAADATKADGSGGTEFLDQQRAGPVCNLAAAHDRWCVAVR